MTALLTAITSTNPLTWQEVCYRAIDIIYMVAVAYMAYKFGKKGVIK